MNRAKPTPSSNNIKQAMAMDKKIPENPKYKATKSKINSGNTVNKVKLICKLTCFIQIKTLTFPNLNYYFL